MTRQEKTEPEIINASRKRRIALGSGTSVADVNRLLKQFRDMKKMMKQMMGKTKGKRKAPFNLPFMR
jgi:signal recognition particle subunit SRP54